MPLMSAPAYIVIRARLPRGLPAKTARQLARSVLGQPLEVCVTNMLADCMSPTVKKLIMPVKNMIALREGWAR